MAYFITSGALHVLLKGVEPICWPFLETCGRFRFESPAFIALILIVYLGLIALGAASAAENFRICWICILSANLLLLGLICLDYRLRADGHYMLFWLNGVFLFWPQRRWAVPLVLISFYFWAGHLKANYEWLSGSVLYHDLWLIPRRFNPLACAYAVLLETVMIWGLLSQRRLIRLVVLGQLVLFHVESLSQILWFYPALMGTMLAWFVIQEVNYPDGPAPTLGGFFLGEAPVAAYALVAFFAGFQLMPSLYRGDPTLTGQGRIFALHMFEARQMCEVSATLHYVTGQSAEVDLKTASLPNRIICDPIVYYSRVKNLCMSRRPGDDLIDLDFHMKVKRTTDPSFTTIVEEPGFCGSAHSYSLFSNNSWMK